MTSARRPLSEGLDLACFELEGQTYAVAIDVVREILATPTITPLPDAPVAIEGVIDLRGRLIPVVDLARLLVLPANPSAGRGRTVVVAVDDLVLAFRVDRATQVVSTQLAALEPLPDIAREAGCRVVSSALRLRDRGPILVLDLMVVVERLKRGSEPGRADAEEAA